MNSSAASCDSKCLALGHIDALMDDLIASIEMLSVGRPPGRLYVPTSTPSDAAITTITAKSDRQRDHKSEAHIFTDTHASPFRAETTPTLRLPPPVSVMPLTIRRCR
jgi:hypothetical protein